MLLTNLQSLQAVLASAVATTQPVFCTYWADHTATAFTPEPLTGTANGTTAVTIVAAPASGTKRQVKEVSLYNADSASVTATIRINDNGTNRTLRVVTLLPGETLQFVDGHGWSALTSAQSYTPPGDIVGLPLIWVGGGAITVGSGSAHVQGLARRVDVSSPIAKSSLSLSASTWYHVYLFESSGVADVEIVTTAPAAAYNGIARSKTGDTSRRYLGSVLTTAAGAISKFTHDSQTGTINYEENINAAPYVVLSGGAATSATSVSCSAVVPTTGRSAILMANNNASAQYVYMSTSNAVNSLSTTFWKAFITPSGSFRSEYRLDGSQALNYMYDAAPSGGNAFIRVSGYTFER